MNKQQEALKLALEALIAASGHVNNEIFVKVMMARDAVNDAIKEALAEQPAQQQEPVAWEDEQGNVRMTLDAGEIQSSVGYVYSVNGERIKNACIRSDIPNGTPLYTSPPASKPWVGLTEQERNDLEDYCEMIIGKAAFESIEAKLKEKNA